MWGLGGNANFNELFRALAPLLVENEADVNPGRLVNILLPLVNRFQSGVITGLKTPPTSELAERLSPRLLGTEMVKRALRKRPMRQLCAALRAARESAAVRHCAMSVRTRRCA